MTSKALIVRPRPSGWSIPLGELAFCADCKVAFSCSETDCPRCAAENGIFRLWSPEHGIGGQKIRETLDECEGVLLTISRRLKSDLALRMVKRIQAVKASLKTKRPATAATDAGQDMKGAN